MFERDDLDRAVDLQRCGYKLLLRSMRAGLLILTVGCSQGGPATVTADAYHRPPPLLDALVGTWWSMSNTGFVNDSDVWTFRNDGTYEHKLESSTGMWGLEGMYGPDNFIGLDCGPSGCTDGVEVRIDGDAALIDRLYYSGHLGAQGGLAGSSWTVGGLTCPCNGTTCTSHEIMTLNPDGTSSIQSDSFFCPGYGSGTWSEKTLGFDETSRALSVVWLGDLGSQTDRVGLGFRRQ